MCSSSYYKGSIQAIDMFYWHVSIPADCNSDLSHSGGGERHSSKKRSAAGTRWYIDHGTSAAIHHPRQNQSGHQSSDCNVPIHQIQEVLFGHFNQALGWSQRFIETVYQEANIFTPQCFFDGLAGHLVQGEVSWDHKSFHSIILGEVCTHVSNRGGVPSDKDDANGMPGQLLCVCFGYRLRCTWQERWQSHARENKKVSSNIIDIEPVTVLWKRICPLPDYWLLSFLHMLSHLNVSSSSSNKF